MRVHVACRRVKCITLLSRWHLERRPLGTSGENKTTVTKRQTSNKHPGLLGGVEDVSDSQKRDMSDKHAA